MEGGLMVESGPDPGYGGRRYVWFVGLWRGLTLLAAAGGPLLIGWDTGVWRVLTVLLGVALVVAAVVYESVQQVRLARRRAAEQPLRDQFHESIRDALKPIAEYIEQLPTLPAEARLERLRTATVAAATALVWELRSVDGIRANVFALNQDDDLERMVWMAHVGRGDTPRPFVEGTVRGDAALKFIRQDDSAFYPDLDREHPPGWEGSGSGYRTFISVPVFTENNRYGMVTVDAPKAGALSLGDRFFVEVVAELMAVAFEVATTANTDDSLPVVAPER